MPTVRGMTRPKEFDRSAALDAAKNVFWKQGYAATTTEDLRRAMNVGRQSFYDTFVGKREAFLEVLQRYYDEIAAEQYALVDPNRSPLAGLERVLLAIADDGPQKRALGCLGVATVCELGTSDEEIETINLTGKTKTEALLETLVRDARTAGEIKPGADDRSIVRQLYATMLGMKVLAKGGASPAVLKEIGHAALAGLKATKTARA